MLTRTAAMKPVCPICRNALPNEDRSAPFPFCSARCKKLDLYRWFNEVGYRVDIAALRREHPMATLEHVLRQQNWSGKIS